MKKYQISDDMFTMAVEARDRSRELGLDGRIHVYNSDAGGVYMPGVTHEAYLARMEELAGIDPIAQSEGASPMQEAIGAIMDSVFRNTQSLEKQQPFEISADIVKASEEQRVVYGWASVISMSGEPYYDTQGHAISVEVMEKMANEFMSDVRVAKTMHDGGQVGEIIHSLPLSSELAKSLGIDSPIEGWIIGVKVHSEEVWKAIKAGSLKAFSIGGMARMEDA